MKKFKDLNDQDLEKYSRQIIMKNIGFDGQLKIMNTSILIIGCGGLGTSALAYLSMAGIKKIGIADFDEVNLSNLNRQLLFTINDIKKKKIDVAKRKLEQIGNDSDITTFKKKVNKKNIDSLVKKFEIILDCSDNFQTRYLINKSCNRNKKLLVSAALHNFEIQLFTFKSWLKTNPCYECIFPNIKKKMSIGNCDEMGIISPIAGLGGLFQALTVIKIILDIKLIKFNEFLIFDGLSMEQKKITFKKNKSCCVCSNN